MADHLKGVAEHAVIVDTTASEFVSDMYGMWLGKGVHVVTPNKKVGSGDLKRWKACVEAMAETGAKWGDETLPLFARMTAMERRRTRCSSRR